MEGMLSIFLCQPGAPDNLHLMNLENIKRQGRDERSLAQTFFLSLIHILGYGCLYDDPLKGLLDCRRFRRPFLCSSDASASILKAVLIVFGKQLRLAGSHLLMRIHKLDERCKRCV